MTQWPTEDLERVALCPICGSSERKVLFEALTDRVFGIADGQWTLWLCRGCASAYLDPRPTPASLGRAYAGYYTHVAEDHRFIRRTGKPRTFLHDLVNGYQNHRYCTRWEHARPAGRWLLPLVPSLRAAADAECRHLPRLPATGGRLLDIGCGNGSFLSLAKRCGWNAEGVDFDGEAVHAARSRGLQVQHGGVELLEGRREEFDVVTLSHVIEHVHDPADLLRRAQALIKPGGRLWLETPNIDSLGALRFGADWRGLEPPRHLALFNLASLVEVIQAAGFPLVRQRWRGMAVFEVFAASEALAAHGTGGGASYQGRPPWRAIAAEMRSMLQPNRREFLTVCARK